MRSKTILKHELIPVNTIALGRLVTDIKDPQRRFHDPFQAENLQTIKTIQQNFQETGIRAKNVALGARLTELLSTFRRVGALDGTRVSAISSATYTLLQWDNIFKDACALLSTRKWILDAIEDDMPIYFIVGYRTFVSPSVMELGSSSNNYESGVQLPVSTVVATNIAPGVQLGGVLDPGVVASTTVSAQGTRSFSAECEMVYAVQYCKVVLKWYSSKTLEKSSLGKTRWKIHWGVRGVEETGEDDVLDVELSDDFEVDGAMNLNVELD
jgi:hypothetical protein